MNLTATYPIGKKIQAHHPFKTPPQRESCVVTNHLLGGFSNGKHVGIVVKFDDVIYMDIESGFPYEEGTGT